jgi:precorrin-6Y C5,15-methyltransferase (decarboxylating)
MLTTSSSNPTSAWLSIVGVGLDGVSGLGAAARAALETAALVAGSERQLSLVRPLVRAEELVWPSPLSAGIAAILARRERGTCVLASGDPFFFGIGAALARDLDPAEFTCHPAPSSLSLAAARLGWSLPDCECVSLHGRDLRALIPHLEPRRRILALSWDRDTPSALVALLCARGFGRSRVHVLENLGGASERLRTARANAFDLENIDDLNLLALEPEAEPGALIIPRRASLRDSAFEHDGQLTKRAVRAVTLSALAPSAGQMLWDVGAGAGSIGIEWMLSHASCSALAMESDPARCAAIRRNASALGVPALQVVEGRAPEGLAALPRPDAVFIGGGASEPGVFDACWHALAPGGRLVINGVALETQARLLDWFQRHGGELSRICIENAAPLGSMQGFRPAMPVMQWSVTRR